MQLTGPQVGGLFKAGLQFTNMPDRRLVRR